MSKKSTTNPASRRRDFLKLATLGAVAGAAAVSGQSEKAQAGVDASTKDGSGGYRETEHVKKVYELSRF